MMTTTTTIVGVRSLPMLVKNGYIIAVLSFNGFYNSNFFVMEHYIIPFF